MLVKVKRVSKPTYKVAGEVKRFNPRYTVFSRRFWDPPIARLAASYRRSKANIARSRDWRRLKNHALVEGAWYVADFDRGYVSSSGGQGGVGLYRWMIGREDRTLEEPPKIESPAEASRIVKEAAIFYGASAVGICRLNRSWLYSHRYDQISNSETPLELPEELKYAIVILIEMRWENLKVSPSPKASAEVGLAYSKMAFVAGSLARFIYALGYQAVPCGNDTGLSIPLAVDAGLGQVGRSGLLITPWFGSRVRIAKVLTDLELKPDQPIDFGVTEFCTNCKRCVEVCEAGAIPDGEMTSQGPTVSNNPGVLKWYVDPEKCFEYWSITGMDCSRCIAVCPFSDPRNRVVEEM